MMKHESLEAVTHNIFYRNSRENTESIANFKGITLVALVVTIVVLLILAGITINLVLSDDGIINKTKEAETEHRAGQVEDEVTTWKASKEINKYLQTEIQSKEKLIQSQVERNLLTDIEAQTAKKTGSVKIGSKTINYGDGTEETPNPPDTIEWPTDWGDKKENVTPVESEDEEPVIVPVPAGFVPSTIDGEKKVEEGFVIKQGTDGSKTEGINEFVWVPVLHPEEMFEEVDGKSVGILYEFEGTTSTPITYSASGYREPDIVTEYDGTDATKDASYFTSAISTTMTGSKFKEQLQHEFNEMKDSVKKYKGFYIGRYETGDLSKETAVVKKNNSDIHSQNWYVQYQKSKGIYNVNGIKTSMIWGCAWDATLRWFQTSSKEEVKNFPTNSEEKGNYSGDCINAGSNDKYKVLNIYDMAGNVYDWTIEAVSNAYRSLRRRL